MSRSINSLNKLEMGTVSSCCTNETVQKDGQVDMASLSSRPSPKQNYSSIRSQKEDEDTKAMFATKEEPKKE